MAARASALTLAHGLDRLRQLGPSATSCPIFGDRVAYLRPRCNPRDGGSAPFTTKRGTDEPETLVLEARRDGRCAPAVQPGRRRDHMRAHAHCGCNRVR